MIKAAWIGLGAMGNPMARHLSQQDNIELTVYNRTQSKTEAWLKQNKGTLAATAKEAAVGASFVFSCIGNDDDLVEVTTGENGAFQAMPQGGIFTDHSTTSATVAKAQALLATEKGLSFLDAPVTGGQKGAENGQLSIMVGGDKAAMEKATPLIEAYAKAVRHLGPSGNGQLTKMVNQITIAGVVQGLSEALKFAQRADLNIDDVLSVISKGAAQSWQMDNSGKTMVEGEFNHGFAVDWLRKDLNICIEEAKSQSASIPVAKLVETYLGELHEMNEGRSDITSLIKRL